MLTKLCLLAGFLTLVACSTGGSGAGPDAGPGPGHGLDAGGPESGAGDSGTSLLFDADDDGRTVVFVPGGPPLVCGGNPLVGGSRPVEVRVFAGYQCETPAPLVLLLHDYGSSGDQAEAYFQFAAQADALGFLYAHPDGTKDGQGNEFWNATDACCNVDGSMVDDSTYLDDVILGIRGQFNVDTNRVYVFGYGNGGFMAYRLACDHGRDVTAVADLGGATWEDPSRCLVDAPMSALEIHGTADATFAYDGGTNLGNPYPGAQATIAEWETLDRCTQASPEAGANLDLDSLLPGAETTVTDWQPCYVGSSMALWSIQGGTHTPTLSATFTPSVLGFLLAQKKQ